MADRFVSAGTAEDPEERNAEWLAAQQELDAKALARKQAQAQHGAGLQEGGKTLFETLQANKAAKEEAFQESIKLKNQFRSLDDDEVDFLDEVLESTRKKEQEVKKETSERLEAFRRQREEAEKLEMADFSDDAADEGLWKAGPRKRKKRKLPEKSATPSAKLRKMSSNGAAEEESRKPNQKSTPDGANTQPDGAEKKQEIELIEAPKQQSESSVARTSNVETPKPAAPAAPAGLGLDDYSSDDD